MDTLVDLPPQPEKPKGLHKSIYMPGTTYFRERRMRPLFFGWLCGLLTILATVVGIGLIWTTNYVTNYSYGYGSFPVTFYAAVILAIVTLILLFLVTMLGLPIIYGHTSGIKRIAQIIMHELLFLLVILAVLLTLSLKLSGLSHQQDPYYGPDDCVNCGAPLKGL